MPKQFPVTHPVSKETIRSITAELSALRPTRNRIPTLVFEPQDGAIQTLQLTGKGRRFLGIRFSNMRALEKHVATMLTTSGTVTIGMTEGGSAREY